MSPDSKELKEVNFRKEILKGFLSADAFKPLQHVESWGLGWEGSGLVELVPPCSAGLVDPSL